VSADSLRQSLAEAGFVAEVEARDRLAVIRPRDAASARAITAERMRVSAIAARHGFSHAALELAPPRTPQVPPPSDAALPGD
jgi:hypothetical protein